MIKKSDLADAINCLAHDLTALSVKVSDLRMEVDDLKTSEVKVNIKPTKRGRGRPRKSEQTKPASKKTARK